MHALFYSPEVPKLCVIGCGYGSSRDAAIVASRHPCSLAPVATGSPDAVRLHAEAFKDALGL